MHIHSKEICAYSHLMLLFGSYFNLWSYIGYTKNSYRLKIQVALCRDIFIYVTIYTPFKIICGHKTCFSYLHMRHKIWHSANSRNALPICLWLRHLTVDIETRKSFIIFKEVSVFMWDTLAIKSSLSPLTQIKSQKGGFFFLTICEVEWLWECEIKGYLNFYWDWINLSWP